MVITGFVLFLILALLAHLADRRGRATGAICLFIVSGVALGATAIGPPLLRGATAAVNGIGNAALSFVQSL